MIESFPLYWPENWPRKNTPELSRFNSTFGKACHELMDEVNRLGGRDIILSTNIPLRNDGLPYASAKEPEDSGIAIYFKYKKQDMVFACDKYIKTWENIVAVKKTIEAIRGIERWGASDMMERAFRGFVAIENKIDDWRSILEIKEGHSIRDAEYSYKRLRSIHHPDKGGSVDKFNELTRAIKQAREVLS